MWLTSIAMCYLDCFIDNLNYTFQDFLIIFFELLARITLVIGAISIFPQEPYSNKRVWFYYIIMGGSLTIIDTFIRLAGTLQKVIILIPFEEKCPNPCRQALNAFEHETSSYDKSHQ